MRHPKDLTLALAAGALAAAAPAAAQPLADLASIEASVAAFTGSALGEPGGAAMPIDRRLRLRVCPASPALDWFGPRQDVVQVSCPVPGGWRIYVPLRRDGSAASAAAQPLVARGDAVTVTVSGDGFAISQQGEALESGVHGAWIKVRMAGAKSDPLRARVLRPGLVGIDLP